VLGGLDEPDPDTCDGERDSEEGDALGADCEPRVGEGEEATPAPNTLTMPLRSP